QRCTPLNELIGRTDCQGYADHNKYEHFSASHVIAPDENFTSNERRDKALEKVADLVVRIAMKTQDIRNLKAKWYSCIGIRATEHEHQRVQEDTNVQECGEREAAVCDPKHRNNNEDGKHLHCPSRAVVWFGTGGCKE